MTGYVSYKLKAAFLLLLGVLPAVSSCRQDKLLRSKFRELDQTIESKELYRKAFESSMLNLRQKYENAATDSLKWVYADSLFLNYSFYDVSSASLFLPVLEKYSTGNPELEFRTDINILLNKCLKSDTLGFHSCITSLDTSLVKDSFRSRYHMDMLRILAYEPYQKQYYDLKLAIREEASKSACESEGARLRFAALNIRHQGDTLKALDMLHESYEKMDDIYYMARAAHNIGQIYRHYNNERMAEYWMAQAAIHDLRIARREYTSLYQLAIQLLMDKHYKPAARYINIVVDDAIDSKHLKRFFKSAKLQHLVFNALDEIETKQRHAWILAFSFLIVVLAVIIIFLTRMKKQSLRLKKSYDTISKINRELGDANKIKNNYVFKYMNLSMKYLGQVEEYKHELRRALKSGGTDSVLAMLRSPSESDQHYKEFYNIFDETFLGLFPEFIQRVNELLKPEYRYEETDSLNTELRILAALRLGITDSAQIASFLNCALSSVYTYRYRIRKNALCDKEKFENIIQNIS